MLHASLLAVPRGPAVRLAVESPIAPYRSERALRGGGREPDDLRVQRVLGEQVLGVGEGQRTTQSPLDAAALGASHDGG
jgi:hypothetical protein